MDSTAVLQMIVDSQKFGFKIKSDPDLHGMIQVRIHRQDKSPMASFICKDLASSVDRIIQKIRAEDESVFGDLFF